MRTAAICPTCATFENAICVLYDGEPLPYTEILPLDSLQTALEKIDAALGNIIPSTNNYLNYVAIDDDHPVALTDEFIYFFGTVAGKRIYLPIAIPSNRGRVITVRNAGTATVTVETVSGQLIVAGSYTSTTADVAVGVSTLTSKFISTGTGWVLFV
jgi:hypothetical protein